MTRVRPPLVVQVDVDGLWAVRACYRREERDTFERDPVWSEGVPAFRRLFDGLGMPAGFFIVGRDLELPEKREAAAGLWSSGFEAGNHTYSHRIGATDMTSEELDREIATTDAALRATGAEPVGFRAPGYDVNEAVLGAVRRAGYLYDASYLPTRVSPLLRMAARLVARSFSTPPRQFGRWNVLETPRVPYLPDAGNFRRAARTYSEAGLVEQPVSVSGILGIPLTAAFLFRHSAAQLDDMLAHEAGTGRPMLLLLHGIDAVDCRQPIVFDTFRPSTGGFDLSAEEKLARLRAGLEAALRYFTPVLARDQAAAMRDRGVM